jgi:hypothetical protein
MPERPDLAMAKVYAILWLGDVTIAWGGRLKIRVKHRSSLCRSIRVPMTRNAVKLPFVALVSIFQLVGPQSQHRRIKPPSSQCFLQRSTTSLPTHPTHLMAVASTIYTAIIGCGVATQIFHVPLLLAQRQLFTLKTIVEKAGPKPVDAINKLNRTNIQWASDLEDVINDEDIELVSKRVRPALSDVSRGCMRAVVVGCHCHS